jgi:hypothetical protein
MCGAHRIEALGCLGPGPNIGASDNDDAPPEVQGMSGRVRHLSVADSTRTAVISATYCS